jgi:YegS/Rv2252/BmrU family lipid kinase
MGDERFRTLIVANPQSANGSLGRRWGELQQVIVTRYGAFDHRFTRGPGDGAHVTREALAQGYEMIVAMGGDGTVSEVVDGFFTPGGTAIRPDAVLGVLPFGTGGDFRKTIAAPKELGAGAAASRGCNTELIDVGRLTYTTHDDTERVLHFINIASFGIGGLVDELVNTTTKALGGAVSFALATLRALLEYEPQRVLLSLDGGQAAEVEIQNIAVANGRFFGGGMMVAPHARLDDGQFDVVTLKPMGVADLVLRGHRLYNGTHLSLPQVEASRAARVEAQPADPQEAVLLDVDGETPGKLPATFELLPGALRLKVPRERGGRACLKQGLP